MFTNDGLCSVLICSLALLSACTGQATRLSPGRSYRVVMVADQRARLTPALESILGPPQDSIIGSLTVASANEDSVWGTVSLPVGRIGLSEPPVEAGQPDFVAVLRSDSVSIRLFTRSTDIGLHLQGSRDWPMKGRWVAEQRALSGRFRIEGLR